MLLNCPSQTVDVSFRLRHGEGHYMVYASTGSMRCFECGDVGQGAEEVQAAGSELAAGAQVRCGQPGETQRVSEEEEGMAFELD